jgi:DNA-binding XRE family transcriptional regulator
VVGSGEGRLWYRDTLTRKYLRDAYTRRGLTRPEIAAEVGVDQRTVHRYLVRFGMPLRSSGTRATRRDEHLRPADRLTKRYLAEAIGRRKLSIGQVVEETGLPIRECSATCDLTGSDR